MNALISRLAGLGCALLSLLQTSFGATIIDDLSYTDGVLRDKGAAGGGWSDGWGVGSTTARVYAFSGENLSYSGGGYAITQTGSGAVSGDFNAFRGVNRPISSTLSGTVWFSFLVENSEATDHTGVLFNHNAGNDYDRGTNYVIDVAGEALTIVHSSPAATSTASGVSLALGSTHLIVGSLTLGAGNDTLSVWANPADLLNLGAADLTNSDIDVGSSLTEFGVFSYGATNDLGGSYGFVDALRLSDGAGDEGAAFAAVTGVPEPGVSALILLGLGGLAMRRR